MTSYISVLRPALSQMSQIRNETRRITELLTELPPEVDVEGLVTRTVIKGGTNANHGDSNMDAETRLGHHHWDETTGKRVRAIGHGEDLSVSMKV
jgi:hypothetical protein